MKSQPRTNDSVLTPMDEPDWEGKPATIPIETLKQQWRRDQEKATRRTFDDRWKGIVGGTVVIGGVLLGGMLLGSLWKGEAAPTPPATGSFGLAFEPRLSVSADGNTAYLFNDGHLYVIKGEKVTEVTPPGRRAVPPGGAAAAGTSSAPPEPRPPTD